MAGNKVKGKEIVLAVYNTEDAEGASLALLKADIEYIRKKIGAGNHGNFLLSLNNYGEEIYVAPEDMEKAREVLSKWREEKKLLCKQEQTLDSEEMTEKAVVQEKKVLWARILAIIALAAVVVFYLWQTY